MDATTRFVEMCSRPESEVALDEAALLVAAHHRPSLSVPHELARLDALADGCREATLEAVVEHLFGDLGFRGDRRDYYDARNSYLDEVLSRRLGIPITLSLVVMAVGERLGLRLAGVGMPGHFLVRDVSEEDVFVDAFEGALLDVVGCVRAFRRVHGDGAPFDPGWLAPIGSFAVLARLLANLKSIFLAREDRAALTWCLELRSAVPGVGDEERREYASVLAATGRFGEAATVYDELSDRAARLGEPTEADRRRATRLRARLN